MSTNRYTPSPEAETIRQGGIILIEGEVDKIYLISHRFLYFSKARHLL